MLLSWRWRGILWVILSITGVAWTIVYINYVITNYQAGKVAGVSYEMGFYLILLGYAIVIGGSIWDIIKKRNLQQTSKS
jgi:predicted MFS family arabinose efflux permease